MRATKVRKVGNFAKGAFWKSGAAIKVSIIKREINVYKLSEGNKPLQERPAAPVKIEAHLF